jgi:hypothetical protein
MTPKRQIEHGHPMHRRGVMPRWLEGLFRRRHEAQLVEAKLLGGSLGNNQVR